MRRRAVIVAGFIAAVAGSGLTAVAEPASGTPPTYGYRFSLDGKPLFPETVTVAGRRGEISAGDLIQVDGIWLTLGEEGEYRFRSATEGVLLELGDGQTRWVGVRVEPNYGEGPDFVDGMAALTPNEVHGLWGIRAETWTRSCATKAAFLNLSRVHLTLGQSAMAGHDDLPELPRGLRYLEAMRFVGWKRLQKLTDLVYLDVLPERAFDARLISSMRHLQVLRVGYRPLIHPEALASLQALESLELRFHYELTTLEFARSLPRLRELVIEGTSVRDLSPLAGLSHLERVQANQSLVKTLPEGALPALRELSVVAAQVPTETINEFHRAHPQTRVRHGWNDSLRDALLGVTRVRVGPGEEYTLGRSTPPSYESADAGEIAGLLRLFEVDENQSKVICGCLCGASFEFLSGDTPLETTHLVCNNMLRWSGWPSDGLLAPANATALHDWLAGRGVTGPRDEEREAKAREEGFQRKSARATAGWSPKLRESFEQDGMAWSQSPSSYKCRFFPASLATEFPVAADRILLLLRILGADTGSWSGLDWQEVLADQLLRTYDRSELEAAGKAALLGTDRQLRRGAARFWDGWQSPLEQWQEGRDPALRSALLSVLQEAQSPDLRQRAISRLASWWAEVPVDERDTRLRAGLHDPSEPVREEAMLVAGQLQATWAEEELVRILGGQPATVASLPPAPADELETVDLGADRIARGSPIGEPEVAGLALGYLRSRRAQPLIEERGVATGSAMLRVARALYDDRCDLLTADDFRTKDSNQPLQIAAVEAVVRCRGKHALDLALGYRQATHWWEENHVARILRNMLLAADPPGASTLNKVKTLPELRSWYQQYGAAYAWRFGLR
jgi:hypothetical protein